MNIIHFINALDSGGAEKVLFDTIIGLGDGFNHRVVTISKRGIYLKKLVEKNIVVEELSFKVLVKLLCGPRKETLIHSYLYRSHVFSGYFKLIGYPVVWSVHGSFPKNASIFRKIVGYLSWIIPDKIIFVSKYCLNQHVDAGYSVRKSMVIYNGVDTKKYSGGDVSLPNLVRKNGIFKICMVSRFHPIKDYPLFFEIASQVIKLRPKTAFYLIGKGNSKENKTLMDLINQFCLADHVNLLGEVSNVSEVYPSFDLVVSSSKSESFGLTVLEALLSGVNVSTINLPVIDELLGEYSTNEGLIDNKEMAVRWLQKADICPSQDLKQLISDQYSLQKMLDSYSILYKSFIR